MRRRSRVSREKSRAYQVIFRDVNERIAHISRVQGEMASNFLCECGEDDCASMIKIELAAYDEVRQNGELFIAAPGHLAEGVDRLVEIRSGFDVLVQVAES
jgi:hypothetical protein